MTEELKPVRCGCGGEGKFNECDQYDTFSMLYWVSCEKCGITTETYDTEAEAITAWNKAIGERTAKVEKVDMEFLEIVTEYPKICTYPEFEGKPYYSIKYKESGETIVGFGTYKPDVLSQYLREYFISSAEHGDER
jgi:hypothetical protein